MILFNNHQDQTGHVLNPSRWVKKVFISFAQGAFNKYDAFKWTPSRAETKIVIQDKFSENNINPEQIPLITFNRGPFQIVKVSTDGLLSAESLNTSEVKVDTDVVRGSGSFSCIAGTQATSEHIADILLMAIYTYRELFKENGIKSIVSLSEGESNPIKMEVGGNKVNLFMTPIYIQFEYQLSYIKNLDYNPIIGTTYDLTISGYPDQLLEVI
jgi:hypothetical protein